jgi:hypothetical protein
MQHEWMDTYCMAHRSACALKQLQRRGLLPGATDGPKRISECKGCAADKV